MAHDSALREKAKEMFVVNGFSMDTIQTMLPEVARKTLYNWRKEDNWEELRRSQVKSSANRRQRIEALIDRALDELEVVLDPKLIFALGKLGAELKRMNTYQFTEEREAKQDTKEISDDTWDKIEQKLGLR